MFCPSCGATVQSGQKFCTSCGCALTNASATVSAVASAIALDGSPTPPMGQPLPPPAVTTVMATLPAATATPQYPPAPATTVVAQTVGHQGAAWDTGDVNWEPTGTTPIVAAVHPFRMTPLVAIASMAGVLAVASAFVDVASIEVSGPTGAPTTEQLFKLNDFSTNHMVGAIIAAVILLVGASLGATGRRVGSGLAGGAGLALAGMMSWMIGAVTQRFDSEEFSLLISGNPFTLTTTQDIGFWLAAASALLGGAAFVLSFADARPDGQPATYPVIAALGLMGTAMAVIGPMIPMNDAPFGDQFSNDFVPPATLVLRQLVLILIAVGGIVGFTRNRRWGLGLALGAISIAAWQLITAATESGDIPLSYAGGNLGATDFAPHIVSVIGVAVMVLASVGGLVLAARQTRAIAPTTS